VALPGPRAGEALQFQPPSRGKQSPAAVLAGLRVFVAERFGGLRQAFERMDFHHDGRISCVEFQEIMHGQERYCGLQEAREIFCILARGTHGSLDWEEFRERLGSAAWADALGGEPSGPATPAVQPDGDRESGASWSCCSSESGPRLASHALRALLLGKAGGGPAPRREATEGEADEAATTARTLTSRSSQSCAAAAGRALRQLPPPPPQEQPALDLLSGGCAPRGSSHVEPSSQAGVSCRSSPTGAAQVPPRMGATASDAFLWGHSGPGRHRSLSCQSLPTQAAAQVPPGAGGAALDAFLQDALGRAGEGGGPTAIQRLDESLLSLRAEVAALDAFRASSGKAPSRVAADGAALPSSSRPSHSPVPACGASGRALSPAPGGLCWVRQLPRQFRGRLAACVRPGEALEVLDEALDTGRALSSGHSRSEGTPSAAAAEAAVANATEPSVPSAGLPEVKPEVVAAAVELLRSADARAAGLEAELEERQSRHEAHMAELKRRHREESRRSLRRLLARLAPEPHEACARASGGTAPAMPAPCGRSKDFGASKCLTAAVSQALPNAGAGAASAALALGERPDDLGTSKCTGTPGRSLL